MKDNFYKTAVKFFKSALVTLGVYLLLSTMNSLTAVASNALAVDNYRTPLNSSDGILVENAKIPTTTTFNIQTSTSYGYKILHYNQPSNERLKLDIIDKQAVQYLGLNLALFNRFILGVGVPFILYMDGDSRLNPSVNSKVNSHNYLLGDPWVAARVKILGKEKNKDHFFLATSGTLRLPLAEQLRSKQIFGGNDDIYGDVKILSTLENGSLQLNLNAGIALRTPTLLAINIDQESYNIANIGQSFIFGGGINVPIYKDKISFLTEAQGSVGISRDKLFQIQTLAGARLNPTQNWQIALGAGPGYGDFAVPAVRGFVSISYNFVAADKPLPPAPPAPMLVKKCTPVTKEVPKPLIPIVAKTPPAPPAEKLIPIAGCPTDMLLNINDFKEAVTKINKRHINFATNAREPLANSLKTLCELALVLKNDKQQRGLLIAGHTDKRGSGKYNMRLSIDRALAIKKWLISKTALNDDRFKIYGCGENLPLIVGNTEAVFQVNRRTEFNLLDQNALELLGKKYNSPKCILVK